MSRTTSVKLSMAEIEHLLFLLDMNEHAGTYYGPEGQYCERQTRLIHKLKGAVRDVAEEGAGKG